jgi:3',5'-cyclic AMP phosphodiesterase CpdA
MTEAAAHRPDVMVFGGDISYANNFASCYWAWDDWLQSVADACESLEEGLLLPIVVAIGNHDAGGYSKDPKDILFLTKWFNQQHEDVEPDDRRTYHYHLLGNQTLLLSVDSGHSASVDGEQLDWIEEQLLKANDPASSSFRPNRIATYHVPAYPSIRSFETPLSVDVRKHWSPVWDKYQVRCFFFLVLLSFLKVPKLLTHPL